ncbi:MAG: dihydrodipicolinate synthase family protein [Actinobacteria bacterium]|nr:dihydrodipicolinate synthase family protein [Actinomycetota bacterium]
MAWTELDGVLTALLTPTTTAGEIDLGALDELVGFQSEAGVTGLFVLGTAGQGPMLTVDERRHLAERIVDAAHGRLRVVVHIGALPQSAATDLAVHAVEAGATAISSVPPVYYQPDFPAVRDYYRSIRAAVGDAIPLLAYNNPPATGYDLRPHEAAELHRAGVIAGVKQASASIADLAALLSADVPVWMANAGCNLAAFAMGARGAISTITNVVPKLFLELYEAVQGGRLEDARDLQHRINWTASRLREPTIGALHAACALRGLPAGQPRSPLRMPTAEAVPRIREALDALGASRP